MLHQEQLAAEETSMIDCQNASFAAILFATQLNPGMPGL